MAIVVVGGHARKVGKTSAASALIAALPECRWVAVKISAHGHGRDAVVAEEPYFLTRLARWLRCPLLAPRPANDTARFLAAGARRAYWVSGSGDGLDSAVRELLARIRSSPHVIIESNLVVEYLKPDFCLLVLNAAVGEFKDSARALAARADAALVVGCGGPPPAWSGQKVLERLPKFQTGDLRSLPRELVELVRSRIGQTVRT